MPLRTSDVKNSRLTSQQRKHETEEIHSYHGDYFQYATSTIIIIIITIEILRGHNCMLHIAIIDNNTRVTHRTRVINRKIIGSVNVYNYKL